MPRIVSVIDDNASFSWFEPCWGERHEDCVGTHRLPGAFGGTVQQVCKCACHNPSGEERGIPHQPRSEGAMS